MLTVNVKNFPDNTYISVTYNSGEKVVDLKKRIAEKLNVSMDHQKLIKFGVLLQDDENLDDLKLQTINCLILVY